MATAKLQELKAWIFRDKFITIVTTDGTIIKGYMKYAMNNFYVINVPMTDDDGNVFLRQIFVNPINVSSISVDKEIF